MSISFGIRFITPLLIGGADPSGCDAQGIGFALRGGWRYWCRALLGGILASPNAGTVNDLESELFGHTQRAVFRLQVQEISTATAEFARLPHRDKEMPGIRGNARAPRNGYQPGSCFRITLNPRFNSTLQNEASRNALMAAIWLWGYLGGIGNRSRRGFGSPVLGVSPEGTDSFAGAGLPLAQEFENPQALTRFLIEGINRAWCLFDDWLTSKSHVRQHVATLNDKMLPLESFHFFTLRSLKQVSVSNLPPFVDLGAVLATQNKTGALAIIHGSSAAAPELGQGNPRKASPAYIRLHQVNGGWLPVCTHSSVSYILSTGRDLVYLRSCGFTDSLLETPW